MSADMQRADLVVRAVAAGDVDLAAFRIRNLGSLELRTLCLELAKRVPAPTSGEGSALEVAVAVAANEFGIDAVDITSTIRRRPVVEARQVVCYAGHLLGMPYSHIGRHLERDHSTVMNAVARVGSDARLRRIATSIAGQLGWDREAS